MNRLLALCAVLALTPATSFARSHHRRSTARKNTPAKPAPPFHFPYPIHQTVLPNGLTVVRVPFPSPGLVAYFSLVRVGSRNEVEPGRTGFAHFFEHMMFRGTKRYPEAAREKLIESVGANDNAETSDDFTLFYTVGPTSMLQKLIDIEADRFAHLSYSKPAFETEAKAVLGEYLKDAAGPGLKLEETLDSTAFTKSPYRHTTLGFLKDVKSMPSEYDYSLEFFHRWYTPDDVILFIVGDFDDAQVMSWVKAKYGPWEGHAAKVRIPKEPPQAVQRTAMIKWPQPTLARLINAWHTPGSAEDLDDVAIQDVLGPYLAGPTSPLYAQLVYQRQWAQSVGVGSYEHRDPNLLSIHAVLRDPKYLAPTQEVFNRTIKGFVTKKPDEARIRAIESHLRYDLLMSLDSPAHVAEQLAFYAAIFGKPDALVHLYDRIGQVTPDEIRAFGKRNLLAHNRTIVILRGTDADAQAGKEAHR